MKSPLVTLAVDDPLDPSLYEVDTTPPGADPDEPLAFGSEEDDEDEAGPDAAAFAEEPWSVVDPEAAPPDEEDSGPLSFGGVDLEDDSTFDRWLQSALKATVAPKLVVDGKIGPGTQRAILAFQQRSKELSGRRLTADGVLGKQTIAALEAATDSEAPSADAAPAAARPTATTAPTMSSYPRLTLHEAAGKDGVTEYVISDGEQEVRFSYWTPGYRDYKPFNVSRYRGARKDVIGDADIRGIGYSASEIAILRANALEETGGAFGAINTWDDQIVSWGIAQFAGKAGTLAALLASLKEDPKTRSRFERWFVTQGLDVEHGVYPWGEGETRKGWHVVVRGPSGEVLRGNPAWSFVRTQPLLLGAFMLAGNDPAIQLGQLAFWRESFLLRAIQKRVGAVDGAGGGPVRSFLSSERGLALVVRLHNWMPAYVVRWADRFISELAEEFKGLDVRDPKAWNQALEDAFARKLEDERRAVKKGSYDEYALSLSRARGSFVG